MTLNPRQAIGIFDSGFGGLTVLKAISEALPDEDLLYLGDTARVPYGTRSPRTVARYARSCAQHLAQHDIKCLVVACNTVSAVALDTLSVVLDIPVLGVIHPGARAATEATRSGRIGVLATAGTVASGAYTSAIAALSSRAEVFAQAAPLLVPLVEEGWTEGEVPRRAVQRYLEPLAAHRVDTLLLGCTHYPVLGELIAQEAEQLLPGTVTVVDSGAATAALLREMLIARGLLQDEQTGGTIHVQVTDLPAHFEELTQRFMLGACTALEVEQVDL